MEPGEALRELTGILRSTANGRHAIEREDSLFAGPIVQSTVLNMVQVIFALNQVYLRGDKKLERQLFEMGYCPALLLENLEYLFSAGKNRGLPARQRQIRKEIQAELGEKVRNVTEEGESRK